MLTEYIRNYIKDIKQGQPYILFLKAAELLENNLNKPKEIEARDNTLELLEVIRESFIVFKIEDRYRDTPYYKGINPILF